MEDSVLRIWCCVHVCVFWFVEGCNPFTAALWASVVTSTAIFEDEAGNCVGGCLNLVVALLYGWATGGHWWAAGLLGFCQNWCAVPNKKTRGTNKA
jgi:hypothetical protein